jgi:hypothetical protein
MNAFTDVMVPESRLVFRFTDGRLTSAEIRPQQPPVSMNARARRRERAQQLAKRHGLATRKGRKWHRIAQKWYGVRCLVFDEFHHHNHLTEGLRDVFALARHQPLVPMVVEQGESTQQVGRSKVARAK